MRSRKYIGLSKTYNSSDSVVGSDVQLYLLQCHWTNAMVLANYVVLMYSHFLLDKAQQVFLIHARCGVNVGVNLPVKQITHNLNIMIRQNIYIALTQHSITFTDTSLLQSIPILPRT